MYHKFVHMVNLVDYYSVDFYFVSIQIVLVKCLS